MIHVPECVVFKIRQYFIVLGETKRITESVSMTASGRDSRGRPLGFIESMHQLFVTKYSTCIYWHVGVIQSTQPLQVTHINKALKILAHKQEALQMRILPLNPKQKNPTV